MSRCYGSHHHPPLLSLAKVHVLISYAPIGLHLIFRTIIIVWGVNKLTKKIIRPWSSSNNEVMDFLSRVPDRVQLVNYTENPERL